MLTQPSTLVYRSSWSPIRPLVYSDDTDNINVNKLIDAIFKQKKTNRLVIENNKMYYCPSDAYKRVVRLRRFK
jgi:hypothetical protein